MTEEKQTERSTTTYKVLKFDPIEAIFVPVGEQEATYDAQAVRRLVGTAAVSAGSYVAVAERNWRTVKHGVEQPPPKITTDQVEIPEIDAAFQRKDATPAPMDPEAAAELDAAEAASASAQAAEAAEAAR